jgi:hypothetical protein
MKGAGKRDEVEQESAACARDIFTLRSDAPKS